MKAPTTPLAACEEALRRSGSSFALAFRILPTAQRQAMTAFYAFCREVDDVVDEATGADAARRALAVWAERIGAFPALAGPDAQASSVTHALAWAVRRYGIRRAHLALVLSGVEQDLAVRRYETFAELYEYAYRVASSVGLVCVTIAGDVSPEAARYAELSGVAVQLTNILRDVREDAARGRIYLPREELRAFGVREDDLIAGKVTGALRPLLRFQARRAESYHELACAALPARRRQRLYFAEALRETYRRLLGHLCEADFGLDGRRVTVSTAERLHIALKSRVRPAALWPAVFGARV